MNLPGIGEAMVVTALIFTFIGIGIGLMWGYALGVEWANRSGGK